MEKQNETKKKLLRAACTVFKEKGYEKAKVSEIVALAEVAQGTFYLYFKTKNDCLNQLSLCLMESFLEDIESESEQINKNSADRIVRMVIDRMRAHKNALMITHFEQNNISQETWDKHNEIISEGMSLIQNAFIAKGLSPEAAKKKTRLIDAVFAQFLLSEVYCFDSHKYFKGDDIEELIKLVIDEVKF